MKPINQLFLHFNDGQRLALSFPEPDKDPAQVTQLIRKQLESPYLSIEVDGDLLLIPRTSITYLQITPAPPSLPDVTVVGAKLLD
ncbi:hypothetical protein ACYZT9_13455 [Pseudomonas sp. ZT5P21]